MARTKSIPYETSVLDTGMGCGDPFPCPYGKPGDRLWVREAFAFNGCAADMKSTDYNHPEDVLREHLLFRATADGYDEAVQAWRPSIHMPRWASRILLEITNVRVERVQDISKADALTEGVTRRGNLYCMDWSDVGKPDPLGGVITEQYVANDNPVGAFATYWEKIGGNWDANEWVWVIDFKRINRGNQ